MGSRVGPGVSRKENNRKVGTEHFVGNSGCLPARKKRAGRAGGHGEALSTRS